MLGRCSAVVLASSLLLVAGPAGAAGAAAAAKRQPPLNCGNLELTLRHGEKSGPGGDQTAYDRLLRGHAYEFVDGESIDRTEPQRTDMSGIDMYLAQNKLHPTIVIHFHGGLVDRCNGYTGSASLVAAYDAAGAYAIFPIYNIGPGESIDKGWSGLSARDPRYGGDGRAMSFSQRFWNGQGLVEDAIPDVRSIAVFNRLHQRLAERDLRFAANRKHEDKNTEEHGTLTNREEVLRLGLTPGLNEGFMTGGRAWSYMKYVIDRSLAIDAKNPMMADRDNAAMLLLMREIHEKTKEAANANKPISIVLVGHSTGAIFAAKFLRAWKREAEGEWKKDDRSATNQRFSMLFMAPALRYDVLDQTLTEAGDMLQGRFRTFTMYDGAELDAYDSPIPAARRNYYRLSLLYAISGVFEPWPDAPIFGLQRFYCRPFGSAPYSLTFPPPAGQPFAFGTATTGLPQPDLWYVQNVLKWFDTNHVAHPFAFSPSPLGTPVGMATASIEHGDFPLDFATMSSITALVHTSWDSTADPWTAPTAKNGSCDTMLYSTAR